MARMSLVVLDEQTPKGLRVEVDLPAMSRNSVFKGMLALLMVQRATAAEEHSSDTCDSSIAWFITAVVLIVACLCALVQEVGRSGGHRDEQVECRPGVGYPLGGRPGGHPSPTTTTGTQTDTSVGVGQHSEVIFVSEFGECYHTKGDCAGLRAARRTTQKR
eukprot:5958717-Amphidinium_carterae.1